LNLSVIGFGGGALAGGYGDVQQKNANEAVQKALSLGINFFDTAPYYSSKYSRSEEIMGIALRDVPRHSFIINTKVGRDRVNGEAVYDYTANGVRKSFERSLKRLHLDYVDMLTLHDVEFAPSINQIVTETLPELRKIQKEGKAKYIGISGYPLDILLIIARKFPLDFVLSYSQYCLQNERLSYYIDELQSLGCGIINAAPLVMVFFTKQGPPHHHQGGKEFNQNSPKIAKSCTDNGVDVSMMANKYAVQGALAKEGKITSTLIGMASPDQVVVAVKSLEPMTPKEQEAVRKTKETLGSKWLNYCWRENHSNELQFLAAEKNYVSPYSAAPKAKL
jgi:aryl-alcohol dehydrogenase-like predicted oxidoreductase